MPLEPQTPSFSSSPSQSSHKDSCFYLADNLWRRGLFSSAQKVIQRLILQSSTIPEAISAADFAFMRGMDLDLDSYGSLIRTLVISGEALLAEALYMDSVVGKGLEPDRQLLNSMIICYCKLEKLEEAKLCFDRLVGSEVVPWVGSCNALMKGLVLKDRILEAYDCFCEISKANDTVLNFACYNRLVEGLCRRGFLDEGLHVFDDMVEKGVPLTANICKSLLIGFCKCGRAVEAEILCTEIESHGFEVDKFMYTYLINAYCKGRKMKMSMRLFMRMLKMGFEPDYYVYNTLIHGFINMGLFSESMVLLNMMVDSGLKPNSVTYQLFLHKYCKDNRVDCALKLMDDMIEHDIAPNVHCYTALLGALCKEQKVEEVYGLYHKMLDSRVVPDHVLFFTLAKNHPPGDELYFALTVLQAIAKESCSIDVSTFCSSRPESARDAMVEIELLLDEIAKSGSVSADVAFSIYVIALCMCGEIESALDCMEKMDSLNLVPFRTAFNSLIKLLIEQGLAETAESLLEVMRDNGMIPNQLTFSVIANALCRKSDFSSAIDVLDQIEERGIKPSVAIYNSIVCCLGKQGMVRDAENLFYRMLKFGVDPDQTIFVTMINAYSRNGWAYEARRLFERMRDYNLRPNSHAYTALIPALIKKNMIKKGCLYVDRMLRDGFMPNGALYTSLIKQFLRKREFDFAFRLFCLMNKSGLEQDLVTYITLICGVCRNIREYTGSGYLLYNKRSNYRNEILFSLLRQTAVLPDGNGLRISINSEAEMKYFVIDLIQRIEKVLLTPDLYMYNGIISGFRWAHCMPEAYKHLDRMLQEGLHPNHVTFSILIDGHIQNGEINCAVRLFNKMNANGIAPDRMLFNNLIRGFCSARRLLDALSVTHMMQKRGFSPSESSYEKLLRVFCARGSSVDALRIYEDMISHKYFPCRYNAIWLSSILCKDNKLDEARAVSDMLSSNNRRNYKLLNRRNYKKKAVAYLEHSGTNVNRFVGQGRKFVKDCFVCKNDAYAAVTNPAKYFPSLKQVGTSCFQVNGAKTWPEAMTNAVKGVIGIAKSAKPLVVDGVESKLPLALNLQAKESITSGCRDLFLTYVNILEKCIEFVKHDPFSSLETYLSGNTFFDCNDGLDEFQVCIPEVNNFYHRTIKLSNILLSIYQTKPKKI
ncbi:pentatricopeptide repeat-containing protein [Striga asiatica]|uniref:Pentatricopeptide repeat-containing protein n=1 Tax=Striga asiatica TaxID=4170 RepID=A0A5A7PQ99_STRAF|nr:pentatricopeptide repeat-containing protein [Striga asiatica]